MAEININIPNLRLKERAEAVFSRIPFIKDVFRGRGENDQNRKETKELLWKCDAGSASTAKPGSVEQGRANQDNSLVIDIPGLGTVAGVFDGVGGTGDGAKHASLIARETVSRVSREILEQPTDELKAQKLKDVVGRVHSNIVDYLQQYKIYFPDGAATTISLAIVYSGPDGKPKVMTANVGDSPVGLYQSRTNRRREELYTSDNLRAMTNNSNARNTTKVVGLGRNLDGEVDLTNRVLNYDIHIGGPRDLEPGDVIVLCSDGVSEAIKMDGIPTESFNQSAAQFAGGIVTEANKRMDKRSGYSANPDDATAVVLKLGNNERYQYGAEADSKEIRPYDRVILTNDMGVAEYNWFVQAVFFDALGIRKFKLTQFPIRTNEKKQPIVVVKQAQELQKVDTELFIRTCTTIEQIEYAIKDLFKYIYDNKSNIIYDSSNLLRLISIYKNTPIRENLALIPEASGLRDTIRKILPTKAKWRI